MHPKTIHSIYGYNRASNLPKSCADTARVGHGGEEHDHHQAGSNPASFSFQYKRDL